MKMSNSHYVLNITILTLIFNIGCSIYSGDNGDRDGATEDAFEIPEGDLNIPEDLPECLKNLIEGNEDAPQELMLETYPPLFIHMYIYKDQTSYYIRADCCDRFNPAVDTSCIMICAPNGGRAGGGDGKCPEYYNESSDCEIVWESERCSGCSECYIPI